MATPSSAIGKPWTHGRLFFAVREIVYIAAAAFAYSLVRGLTSNREDVAFDHAEDVISLEKALGIFVEPDLQDAVTGNDFATDVVNFIYIYGYWPMVVLTLLWLLVMYPAEYARFRNALLASGAVALVIFATYPLAPPRFLPEHGFEDTIAERASGYRQIDASGLVNEYAAMPSMHLGWVVLFGIALATVGRHPVVRAIGWTMPPLMYAGIVFTGNHYLVDGLVGTAVAVLGLLIAGAIRAWTTGRQSRRAAAAQGDAPTEPGAADLAAATADPVTESVDGYGETRP